MIRSQHPPTARLLEALPRGECGHRFWIQATLGMHGWEPRAFAVCRNCGATYRLTWDPVAIVVNDDYRPDVEECEPRDDGVLVLKGSRERA